MKTTAKTRQRTVAADNAMAGNKDRDGVVAVGTANRANGLWRANG